VTDRWDGHWETVDATPTVDAFREAAENAREGSRLTEVTYALPRMTIFPTPDGTFITREVRLRVHSGVRAAQVVIEANAARVRLAPEAGPDDPPFEVLSENYWIDLPDEVAALFAPPEDGNPV
jgi:hypothetical protein